jgi:hypothetical protein
MGAANSNAGKPGWRRKLAIGCGGVLVVAYGAILGLYILVWPVGFTDSLFEPNPQIEASVVWSQWEPWPETLPRPREYAAKPPRLRKGVYHGLLHTVHVAQVGYDGEFEPSLATFEVRTGRVWAAIAVPIGAILIVLFTARFRSRP